MPNYLIENDNIHKNEVQEIRWSDKYFKISKLIFQNSNVKNVCKNVKNQQVATLSILSLTVSVILIPSLKVIGQF